MTNPQQPELRRNAKNSAVQDSKVPGPPGHTRGRGTSNGDTGRPLPKGQASPFGPAGEPLADDESDRD